MNSLLLFAAAGAVASAADIAVLDPYVVVATGAPEPLSETLPAVDLIDGEALRGAGLADVGALLARLPGVDVVRNGGPGQLSSVFIRGAESNHTLVLIDGVRVNPATAGGAAVQNIDPSLIERIEVLRGPRATLYGSDAIGGVINIITRSAPPQQQTELDLTLGAGELSTEQWQGAVSHSGGAGWLALSAAHYASDGIPSCSSSDLDRGYRRDSASMQARTQVSALSLDAAYWVAQGRSEYLDFCSAAYGNQPLSQDFFNDTASLRARLVSFPGWTSSLALSYGRDHIDQRQAAPDTPADQVHTERPAIVLGQRWVSGGLQLALGAEWSEDQVAVRSFGSRYAEDRGQRRGWLQLQGEGQRQQWAVALSRADVDGQTAATTGNVEYGYRPRDGLRLSAAVGSGFRAPDASELYGFGGNPQLDAETSGSVELGMQAWLGAAQRVDVRVYRQQIDDLISLEYSPSNDPDVDFGYRAVNIDETRNDGLELGWQLAVGGWRAALQAAWQNPVDRSDDSLLLRRARESAQLSLQRQTQGWSAGLVVEAHGERADIDAETGAATRNAAYALLHADASWQPLPQWTLRARVDNLLDRQYQSVAGYGSPGVAGYASLSYHWTHLPSARR